MPRPPRRPRRMTPRPDIFVVGDAKCGTTTLYRMLQLAPRHRHLAHPQGAALLLRARAGAEDRRPRRRRASRRTSSTTRRPISPSSPTCPPISPHIADVSPSYLQEPAAAARIQAFAPDARIVILLREPAAKIMSQYTHLWAEGRETLPFEDAFAASEARRAAGWSTMFDYEAGGRYAAAVERYLELFGRDRVMVALFEELSATIPPPATGSRPSSASASPEGPPPRMNIGGRVKSPVMAALMGNEALRGALKRLLPLGAAHPGRPAGARRGPGREARARPRHRRGAAPPLRRRRRPARGADRPADRLAGRLTGDARSGGRMFRARNIRRRAGQAVDRHRGAGRADRQRVAPGLGVEGAPGGHARTG